MAQIGLTEAAKLTGKDKATIHRAMKSGRLSYSMNDNGERMIDPSELERVFPIKPSENDDEVASRNQRKIKSNHSQLTEVVAQLEAEKVRSGALQERLADKDEVIEDLRKRLDTEAEERRRTQSQLTALLTDQREKPEPPRRRWFGFGKRS